MDAKHKLLNKWPGKIFVLEIYTEIKTHYRYFQLNSRNLFFQIWFPSIKKTKFLTFLARSLLIEFSRQHLLSSAPFPLNSASYVDRRHFLNLLCMLYLLFYGKLGLMRVLTSQWGFTRPSSIYFNLVIERDIFFHLS